MACMIWLGLPFAYDSRCLLCLRHVSKEERQENAYVWFGEDGEMFESETFGDGSYTVNAPDTIVHVRCNQTAVDHFRSSTTLRGMFKGSIQAFIRSMMERWPLWPVQRDVHAYRLAASALLDLLNSTPRADSRLSRLPNELLLQIGELSWPSALTTDHALRTNISFLCGLSRFDRAIYSTEDVSADRIEPVFLPSPGGDRVADIICRASHTRDKRNALIVAVDAISCVSFGYAPQERRKGSDLWFRVIRPEQQASLRIVYKGAFVADILPVSGKGGSYLWDHQDPPELLHEHSFCLPGSVLNLEHAWWDLVADPIRLRRVLLGSDTIGLLIGCQRNCPTLIRAHHQDDSLSAINRWYEDAEEWANIEDDFRVFWQYVSLAPDTRIAEIVVCWSVPSLPDQSLTLIFITTDGQTCLCGPALDREFLGTTNFTPLVTDRSQVVTGIYARDKYNMSEEHFGLAVTTERTDGSHAAPDSPKLWSETVLRTLPVSRDLLMIGDYCAEAHIEDYKWFEACLDEPHQYTPDLPTCVGIRLGGNGRSRCLGQWRIDKEIVRHELPTGPMLLSMGNEDWLFDEGLIDKGYVVLSDRSVEGGTPVPLVGLVEWTCVKKHSSVMALSEDGTAHV